MQLEIPIEDYDIKNGKRINARECPIALATMRILKIKKVMVSIGSIFINDVHITIPSEATNFIYRHDFKKNPKPFVMKLEVKGWHGMLTVRIWFLSIKREFVRLKKQVIDPLSRGSQIIQTY